MGTRCRQGGVWGLWLGTLALALGLGGCAALTGEGEALPEPEPYAHDYVIGPGDSLNVFVWRNPELTSSVTVRPDGKISVPLVEDLVASGKTPTELAREVEEVLSTYVREPLVTIMVGGFIGVFDNQIRVVGEATQPQSLPYRVNMSLLDVMIAVGGLTDFAAGNRARLVRRVEGEQHEMVVRLDDLVKDGDITANVPMAPGDILIIPEAWF